LKRSNNRGVRRSEKSMPSKYDREQEREQEEKMLRTLVRKWGKLLLYIFDRGYATGP
jgi:hypothetical protein